MDIEAGLSLLLFLPPTYPNIDSVVFHSLGGRIMMISWGEFQNAHLSS